MPMRDERSSAVPAVGVGWRLWRLGLDENCWTWLWDSRGGASGCGRSQGTRPFTLTRQQMKQARFAHETAEDRRDMFDCTGTQHISHSGKMVRWSELQKSKNFGRRRTNSSCLTRYCRFLTWPQGGNIVKEAAFIFTSEPTNVAIKTQYMTSHVCFSFFSSSVVHLKLVLLYIMRFRGKCVCCRIFERHYYTIYTVYAVVLDKSVRHLGTV